MTETDAKPLAIDLFCGHCGAAMTGRSDKKYCSSLCAQRHKSGRQTMPFTRHCLVCGKAILVAKRGDANRRYCSQSCAKRAYAKGIGIWRELHPERVAHYRTERVKKNADVWKEQARSERKRILAALGGACIVCGVSNPSWLHVDYIPTTRGQPFRHPRTLRFTLENPHLFRVLCGLGGWADVGLASGYDVIGFDIERHVYGEKRYPAQLVIQDVLTLHGSQFRKAALIVASPPCQEFSWMAMPWSRAKQVARAIRGEDQFPPRYRGSRTPEELTRLFDACFRIQREACEAAGRHIPMVVENVRGAQEWVGRARWNFGSYYVWGDVPALMPPVAAHKSRGLNWSDATKRGQDFTRVAGRQAMEGRKAMPGGKDGWFGSYKPGVGTRALSSTSPRRKEASAMIAKIPLPLSRHIARVYHP